MSLSNLIQSIEHSASVDLFKLIYSLGIEEVGETTARNLANRFGNFDDFQQSTFEDLIAVTDIGPRVASKIIDYFNDNQNQKSLQKLIPCLDIINLKINHSSENMQFAGLQIAITGKIIPMSRDEAKDLLLSKGAKVTNSLSKKTNFLIAGENAGSKLDKAKTLGVKIVDANDINAFINDPKKF